MTRSFRRAARGAKAGFRWLIGAGVVVAWLAVGQALAAAGPEETPRRFTTDNYGLTVQLFAGLFHCAVAPTGVGSDHGVILYLAEPAACDPQGATAAAAEADLIPRIRLFYSYNVAEIARPGGGSNPPRTNGELPCVSPATSVPIDLKLLGMPGVGCVVWQGDRVSLSIGTLYGQDPGLGTPDSVLWVTLETTRDRYPRDLRVFRTVLWGIRQCTRADQPSQRSRPRCPSRSAGW